MLTSYCHSNISCHFLFSSLFSRLVYLHLLTNYFFLLTKENWLFFLLNGLNEIYSKINEIPRHPYPKKCIQYDVPSFICWISAASLSNSSVSLSTKLYLMSAINNQYSMERANSVVVWIFSFHCDFRGAKIESAWCNPDNGSPRLGPKN